MSSRHHGRPAFFVAKSDGLAGRPALKSLPPTATVPRFCFSLPALVALVFSLSGCTTLERTVAPGRDPAALKEVFVATNLNDYHQVARHIAAAIRARGLVVESGPLTMLPASAEAVVQYQDRWSWDFGEHMVYLQITLSDPGELRPYATAWRQKHIESGTRLEEVVPPVVEKLLAPVSKK